MVPKGSARPPPEMSTNLFIFLEILLEILAHKNFSSRYLFFKQITIVELEISAKVNRVHMNTVTIVVVAFSTIFSLHRTNTYHSCILLEFYIMKEELPPTSMKEFRFSRQWQLSHLNSRLTHGIRFKTQNRHFDQNSLEA